MGVMRKQGQHFIMVLALAILLVIVVAALTAPWIVPMDPHEQNLDAINQPPALFSDIESPYLLGTDSLGRDVLSRMIFGARISLLVGVVTVVVRGGVGTTLGLVAGYYGGRIDDILMRIADIQLALPFLVVVLAIISVVGPGIFNLIMVLGLTGWVYFGRIMRSEVLSIRNRDFVEAARAGGASDFYIIVKHVLPNAFSAILVVATLQIASIIIAEASLSFLGVGIPAQIPTWGKMIAEGRASLGAVWWVPSFPGLAIFAVVLSINLLGDWLRDFLDPKLKRSAG
jgi:peptide/nickel transport system permease protein